MLCVPALSGLGAASTSCPFHPPDGFLTLTRPREEQIQQRSCLSLSKHGLPWMPFLLEATLTDKQKGEKNVWNFIMTNDMDIL